jgi:hypothetical protein
MVKETSLNRSIKKNYEITKLTALPESKTVKIGFKQGKN